MLKVTNNATTDFKDRFNGTDYVFPAGKAVMLGEDAARHIFGFGEADKTATLIRQGWLLRENDRAQAMDRLGQFAFAPADLPGEGMVVDAPPPLLPESEQGSAPLHPDTEEETALPVVESPVSTTPPATGAGNILDALAGAAGAA